METKLSVVFTGDVMTHANQINAAEAADGGYDFSGYFTEIEKYVRKADLAVCNVETTLCDGEYSRFPRLGVPRFKTPEQLAGAIAEAGFQVAAAANNHSYDNGLEGIVMTRRILEDHGLTVIGTRTTPGERAYTVKPLEGVNVALLNFTYESGRINGQKELNKHPLDEKSSELINSFCFETLDEDLENVRKEINSARSEGADIVLVYYHWGEEYDRYSKVQQKYIAWSTAKMGADAIIGSHPHVLQELEYLPVTVDGREKTVPVFYSLGNYIWGEKPIGGRETVLNTVLAVLNIRYDPAQESPVLIQADYVPLCISLRDETGKAHFTVADISQREEFKKQLEEISDTMSNKIRPLPTALQFDRHIEVEIGKKAALIPDYLPEGEYVRFGSEDAGVASVLRNGEVVGNAAGYVGITAVTSDGREICLMAHVYGEGKSALPVVVNANNRVRDLYTPAGMVYGDKYFLSSTKSRLLPEAAEAWVKMRAAAENEGVILTAASGFRTKRGQLDRINRYAERYGIESVRKRYQPIGGSEHHLGLALDIIGKGGPDGGPSLKEAITWVWDNAWKYGFIARNANNRKRLNFMAYVHVRYVGSPAEANYITRNGLSMDEYLQDYDKHQKNICAEDSNVRYAGSPAEANNTTINRLSMDEHLPNYNIFQKIIYAKDSRKLTLRKICGIIGIEVPDRFKAVQDNPVPTVSISRNYAQKGDVNFIIHHSKYAIESCREVYKKGALAIFADQTVYNEVGPSLPVIVLNDPASAAAKVGRYIRELYPAKTVCVTGTAGKTTTTELIYLVLASKFNTHVNNTLANANGCMDIIRVIQDLQPEHEIYVQETGGSFPGHVNLSSTMLQPDVSVVTNIGLAHIDMYKTFECLREDKCSIYENTKPNGLVVLNLDDENLRGYVTRKKTVTCSVKDPSADYFASDILQTADGLQLSVTEKRTGETTHLKVDVPGRHNAYNITVAFAIGRWAGMSERDIMAALAGYHARGIRQAMYNVGNCHVYMDAFSTTPLSVISTLGSLSEMACAPGAKKIAVTWELFRMGSQLEEQSKMVGKAVRDMQIDELIVFGQNGKILAEEMSKGRIAVRHTENWKELMQWLKDLVRPGDIILFKSSHLQSASLAAEQLFGLDLRFNSRAERADSSTAFSEGPWKGVIFHKNAAVIDSAGVTSGDVTIPDQIQDKPVIYLNKKLFAGRNIQSAVIGEYVSGIAEQAFYGCAALERVTFGRGLRNIGPEAFAGCARLEEIELPRGCLHINSRAFAECSSLKRVLLPKSVGYIAEDAFAGCPNVELVHEGKG